MALIQLVHERLDVAKIVGQVAIAHDDVIALDVGQRVDVGSAQATLGGAQDLGAVFLGNLGRPVGGAVDDEDLPPHPRFLQTFPAPIHEFANDQLFVEARNDDGNGFLGRRLPAGNWRAGLQDRRENF